MLFFICSRRALNFLSFCNFVVTRITALLTELYRFNPKPAQTFISDSERMGELYSDAGKQEKAIEHLIKAKEMFKEMAMDYWLTKTKIVLAKL